MGRRSSVFHYKNAKADATHDVLQYATLAMQTYNKTYGEYPFANFDVVENPTPTGVEYPGVVEVSEAEWSHSADYLEVIVCHEVAHQWFYSMVGDDQVNHPWLDESLASYSEFVYWRVAHPDDADNYISRHRASYLAYIATGAADQPARSACSGLYIGSLWGDCLYQRSAVFRRLGKADWAGHGV